MKGRTLLSKPEERQGGQCGWGRVSKRTVGCRVRGARGQLGAGSEKQEDSWVQGQRSKSPGDLGLMGTVRTLAFPLGEAGALQIFGKRRLRNSLKISKPTQAALLRMACDLAVS